MRDRAGLLPAYGGLALVLLATACSGPGQRTVCAEGKRSQLLAQRLVARTPSAPFTVPAGGSAWLQVTQAPSSYDGDQPFGRGGIQVYFAPAGAAPRIHTDTLGGYASDDPTAILPGPLTWVQLTQPAGAWTVYSLLQDPEVLVVACP